MSANRLLASSFRPSSNANQAWSVGVSADSVGPKSSGTRSSRYSMGCPDWVGVAPQPQRSTSNNAAHRGPPARSTMDVVSRTCIRLSALLEMDGCVEHTIGFQDEGLEVLIICSGYLPIDQFESGLDRQRVSGGLELDLQRPESCLEADILGRLRQLHVTR